VNGTRGVSSVPTAGASRQAFLAGVSEAAVDARVLVTPESVATGSGFGYTSSIQVRRTAMNTEYRARLRFAVGGAAYLAITRVTGSSTETILGSEVQLPGITVAPGSPIALRVQIWGSSPSAIRAKAWDPSGSEPGTWDVSTSDSTPALQGAGAVGLMTYASGSSTVPVIASVDDLLVYREGAFVPPPNQPPVAAFGVTCAGPLGLDCTFDASSSTDSDGTITGYAWDFGDGALDSGMIVSHSYASAGDHSASLTVTDDDSDTGSTTQTVSIAPAFTTLVASDAFARTSSGTWGSSDLGGAYSYPPGHAATLSVDGALGVMSVPTAGASRQTFLGDLTESDVDGAVIVTPGSVPTGTGFGYAATLQLRRSALNTEYRARLRFGVDGNVYVALTRVTGSSTETLIGSEVLVPGVTTVVGSPVAVRFQIWGMSPTNLRVKAWDPSGSEPGTWNVAATDGTASLQTGGAVGFMTYASGTSTVPVVASFDDLFVYRRSS
jgi:PKD repeat protein